MVLMDRRCSECGSEMLLDRVVTKGDTQRMYYTCVNPNCKERGKAYSPNGEESQSSIKERA